MSKSHRHRFGHRPRLLCAAACVVEQLEQRCLLDALPAITGSLSGKVVYTSGGHGYEWNGSSWVTGRPLINGMVEDFGNQDQMSFYANDVLQAGATVVPMRPVGHQTNQVIVDNSDAGFSIVSGTWNASVQTPYFSDHNGNDTAHYMYANTATTETAVARFTPNIPVAGFYPVYVWAKNDTDRVTDAMYRINYSGGSQDVKINNVATGKGFIYLGTYYFDAGAGQNVEVSNQSATAGNVVIADAVQFGNGMGDWTPTYGTSPVISGQPREDEASYYWVIHSRGYTAANTLVPLSTFNGGFTTDDDSANVGAPARWGAYMNSAALGQSVYLGIHSNAADGSGQTRGDLGLYNNETLFPNTATPNQIAWADLVGHEINDELSAITAPPLPYTFHNSGSSDAAVTYARTDYAFGEIRSSANGDEFDATIAEVAYHDNASDAAIMEDPDGRSDIARALYHATVKYFAQFGGGSSTYMPDAPTDVRAISNTDGSVTLHWTAPKTDATTGGAGAATSYKIYYGYSDYGFSDVVNVGNVTSYTLPLVAAGPQGHDYRYFKVVAVNAGGESIQNDVVAAQSWITGARILIVNGFDRLDQYQDQTITANGGSVDRVRLRYNNTRDYVYQFADAINAYNDTLGYDTVQNEDVISGAVNLSNYQIVLWISGDESTADHSFDATEQAKVTAYINGGGKFFASGAEIGYDLVYAGNGASFFNNTLHAGYSKDDANTYSTNGTAGSIFAGLSSIVFDNGANQGMSGTYDVAYPDVLTTSAGSTAALSYSGGTGGTAAVQWSGGASKVVTMGFPFETITSAANRNAVMAAVLNYFNVLQSLAPGAPMLLATSDTGKSSSDNETYYNNSPGNGLAFQVSGTTPGATVRLYWGSTLIGDEVATTTTTTVYTNQSTILPDGTQVFTATQLEYDRTESAHSSPVSILIDTTAPTASVSSMSGSIGGTTIQVNVSYADAGSGIDSSQFDNNDLSVSGPNNFLASLNFVSFTGNNAVYQFTAPGGGIDYADAGNYKFAIYNNQVGDIAGNFVASGLVGTLDFEPPFAYLSNRTLIVQFADAASTITTTADGTNLHLSQGIQNLSYAFTNFDSIEVLGTSAANHLVSNGTLVTPITFDGAGGADIIESASGTLTLSSDVGGSSMVSVFADTGAAIVFGATQHLSGLTVSGNASLTAGDHIHLVTHSISIAGALDLTDNTLMVNYQPGSLIGTWNGSAYTGLTGLIAQGRDGGAWDGSGIITSMPAAKSPSSLTSIGIIQASTKFGISGSQTASFQGETVSQISIIIKYTYAGDANVDGKLNGDDYFAIDSHVNQNGSVFGWANGDFNYDGRINGDDYFLIDSNINMQGSPL